MKGRNPIPWTTPGIVTVQRRTRTALGETLPKIAMVLLSTLRIVSHVRGAVKAGQFTGGLLLRNIEGRHEAAGFLGASAGVGRVTSPHLSFIEAMQVAAAALWSFRLPRFNPSAAAASCMSRQMTKDGYFERAVSMGAWAGDSVEVV